MKMFNYNAKFFLAFFHDVVMGVVSFLAALALRYSITQYNFIEKIPALETKLILIVIIQAVVFTFFGLYRGVWRFSSTHDLKQIIKASAITTLLTTLVFHLTNNMELIPRTSLIMHFCLLVLSIGGGRFIYRMYKESQLNHEGENTIIIGAGNAAEQLIRDIKRYYSNSYKVIGLLDDDHHLKGRSIHGHRVFGQTNLLPSLAKDLNIVKVFIAIPSATSADLRRIVTICESINNLDVKILPNVEDIINGKVTVSSLRQIKLDDLLGRDPIQLDLNSIGKMLTDKTILVSGAGGSIGSELAGQVAKFNPRRMIILDVSEFLLYEINRKLTALFPDLDIVPIVADIKNRKRIAMVMHKYMPEIIYHAAAYKQVPLMETNHAEAFETNVLGTWNLAKVAKEAKVKRFVMVSTDKAVNPTNIMGATKRIAEMICQELSDSKTKFTNVRFGNVLGSNGSVIPLFEEQIHNGGPVTVTHKDITRYFMSIPEAAQLILQAGSMGYGGEIFVLDMGDPIKIYDLAVNMIRLSGLKPFEDIDIKITGLRPGEKLYEELLADDENTLKTPHPSVRVACARNVPKDLIKQISNISQEMYNMTSKELKLRIKECVTEYSPDLKESSNTGSITIQ
jgi:FlaA1/EpsC-like NDP-sugar epimerase